MITSNHIRNAFNRLSKWTTLIGWNCYRIRKPALDNAKINIWLWILSSLDPNKSKDNLFLLAYGERVRHNFSIQAMIYHKCLAVVCTPRIDLSCHSDIPAVYFEHSMKKMTLDLDMLLVKVFQIVVSAFQPLLSFQVQDQLIHWSFLEDGVSQLRLYKLYQNLDVLWVLQLGLNQ